MENIVNSFFDLIFNIVDFLFHADYLPFFYVLKVIGAFLSALLVCGIFYNVFKTNKIYEAAHLAIGPKDLPPDTDKNLENWQKILANGRSENENDRKLAIIEADSLIEKILGMSGYSGENLGEKLKNIEPADLDSLDALWAAHKTRNRIAHEPNYKVSKDDAEQALALFQKALKELEYIV